jgi:hypothetical protein
VDLNNNKLLGIIIYKKIFSKRFQWLTVRKRFLFIVY